jgi:uncharacterized protein (TIGR00297 family)
MSGSEARAGGVRANGARANELARGLVHLGVGFLALTLRWLSVPQAALIAAAAVIFNYAVLPRLAGTLFREGERRAPLDSGIHLYPFAVLLLVLLFGWRPEVAAAGWVIMATGDPAARAAGRTLRRRPLPWNPAKTVAGTAAFAAAAGAASVGILIFMGRPVREALLLGLPTAVFAAFVESLPWRLNDNLTVPLLSALFLCGLTQAHAERLPEALAARGDLLLQAVIVNLVLAVVFRSAGTVDRSGMVAGFLVGTLTWFFAGWRGFVVLVAFFVLGSGATRLGRRRKERLGVAQGRRGARSARHALANCGVAVYLAMLAATAPSPGLYALAFVCAYATAAFDTVSSEIGQAWGGSPVLITTLRPVPVGTDGAVSLLGTLSGFAAAALIALLATGIGLLGAGSMAIILVAAFVGSSADSILGATLERAGLMDNEAVNFSNTLVGALAGIAGELISRAAAMGGAS